MAALETPEVTIGWKAVDFSLDGVDGRRYALTDVAGPKGLLVMFICNHCPFVKAIVGKLVQDAKDLQALGVGVVAIMPNDVVAYPEDDFPQMQAFAALHGFSFPYVIDRTQVVAKAYGAVCTPDFFGFNAALELQYRGRLDGAGRSAEHQGPRELLEAMKQVAELGRGPEVQLPSIGCSIKWAA